MTEVNYTHILLDAIYEHSKFSSEYIIRECIKAKDKHINKEEFYSSLLDMVKYITSIARMVNAGCSILMWNPIISLLKTTSSISIFMA